MNTYLAYIPTGNERYNVDVPEVLQNSLSVGGRRVVGSIHLKSVTQDAASAIMLLCNANNIPGTITQIQDIEE